MPAHDDSTTWGLNDGTRTTAASRGSELGPRLHAAAHGPQADKGRLSHRARVMQPKLAAKLLSQVGAKSGGAAKRASWAERGGEAASIGAELRLLQAESTASRLAAVRRVFADHRKQLVSLADLEARISQLLLI